MEWSTTSVLRSQKVRMWPKAERDKVIDVTHVNSPFKNVKWGTKAETWCVS